MLVRGRKLVDQASQRLIREGVPHGVLMAGHWNYNPKELIQICSIDTVARRMSEIKKVDIAVIDECHMAAAESFKKFLAQFPDAYKLGVTATPYQRATITHIAEHVVKPITMIELIEQGYLVPAKYYAPSQPDLTGVKIKSSTGDYDEEQLEARCNKIIGDLATNWKRYGENRPTICFAININHSKNIVAHLLENGIPAAHIDADSTDTERQDVLDKLSRGELKIVSNVGILTTGVDLPFVSCILMARPTLSLNLHIQILGRATRPHENKTDFIVLDHGNNVSRHGFITTERDAILEFKKGSSKIIGVPPVATCEICYAVFPVQTKLCPQCGHENEKADRKIVSVDGELKLLTDEQYEKFKINIRFHELKRIQKEKDYKRGWIYHKMKDEFGETIAAQYVPQRVVPEFVKSYEEKKKITICSSECKTYEGIAKKIIDETKPINLAGLRRQNLSLYKWVVKYKPDLLPPNGIYVWTKEKAIEESKKYTSKKNFKDNSSGAYYYLKKKHKEIYAELYKTNIVYNFESALAIAAKYDHISKFKTHDKKAYKFLRENHKEVFSCNNENSIHKICMRKLVANIRLATT